LIRFSILMNRSGFNKNTIAGSLIALSMALTIGVFLPPAELPPNSKLTGDASLLIVPDAGVDERTGVLASASNDADETGTERDIRASILPLPKMGAHSQQTVFRLVLEDGKCRLDAVEKVTGDFRPRRGSADVYAGMIACRLVGANDVPLAEEMVHAPDHVCAVLDPNASADGPRVSLLAGIGPQVFQVRFPSSFAGEKLEVYRITQTVPEISRTLLLTLPINP